MQNLNELIREALENLGAIAVGFSTTETLAGGPPSADLAYVMPTARSAISFALPLDQDKILSFLKREDRLAHDRDNVRTNILVSGIAFEVSNFLNRIGHKSIPLAVNAEYRTDTERGAYDELPPISHRYLAVRSGVGHFGLSGNVIRKKEGAGIILGSVITEAELEPTDPLPFEDNYCDKCRLCLSMCASGMMDKSEITTVTLGGIDFTYSKRNSHLRCDYVCGGFTGLSKSGKWSTWCPGRLPIPEKDEEFMPALAQAVPKVLKRPPAGGGFHHFLFPGYRVFLTCGQCQLICVADKEERLRRADLIRKGGVVVQNPDGSLEFVDPGEAKKRLAALNPKTRGWYEEV
ncbi:MAG: epoxyqueuosine reductase [Proteobacteria bacterium]|nr:epoxyqueuosine reductase [Pseudomonadota bacterium]